jgi:hypothetical protein
MKLSKSNGLPKMKRYSGKVSRCFPDGGGVILYLGNRLQFSDQHIAVGSSVSFVREVRGNKPIAVDVQIENPRGHMRGLSRSVEARS